MLRQRRILLLGKNGQVGWELQRSLVPLGELFAFARQDCDLSSPSALTKTLGDVRPHFIVNAAAYTAVDSAENNRTEAYRINSEVPLLLGNWAAANNAVLIHYSTDYVFDGEKKAPYLETDATNPLSVYGASKLAGEIAVRESSCRHLIFRTSWVFAARGKNFAKTMLQLAAAREQLSVVGDQCGAPTSAELIADVTAQALRTLEGNSAINGTYHLAARGAVSWYDYANYLFIRARELGVKLQVSDVKSISSNDYPSPVKRPKNSSLDVKRLENEFGLQMPEWRYHVDRMLLELYKG